MDIDLLSAEIKKILGDYGDTVFELSEDGLDEAEEILINELEQNSPTGVTNKYKKGWKSKKYKGRRFVGNTTTVKGKKGDIPLSNILEFSTTKGNPHIQKSFENVANKMANAITNKLK
jgi:hypothetical protein